MTEQVENLIQLSSRKRRIVAFLIDHFILTFLMVSIVLIAIGPDFIGNSNTDRMQSIMYWVMIPGCLLYFSKDSYRGISIGKWVMGIMIRSNEDNEIPSFIKLFVRNLLVIIWPIEFIVLAVSKNKKRLGDLIVKTKVVKNANKPKRLPRVLSVVLLGLCFMSFVYYTGGNALKNSEAYKIAIENIEANTELTNSIGGIKGYGYFPKGNISITNGVGEAQLQITIMGNESDLEVSVHLEKMPDGDWLVKGIR